MFKLAQFAFVVSWLRKKNKKTSRKRAVFLYFEISGHFLSVHKKTLYLTKVALITFSFSV